MLCCPHASDDLADTFLVASSVVLEALWSGGESLAMTCLSQWQQGSRMRQTSRQKLYGFLNWAVQRGYIKPI